jgi:hypothetical protein
MGIYCSCQVLKVCSFLDISKFFCQAGVSPPPRSPANKMYRKLYSLSHVSVPGHPSFVSCLKFLLLVSSPLCPVSCLCSLSCVLCALSHVSVTCLPSSVPCLTSLFLVLCPLYSVSRLCNLSPVLCSLSHVSCPLSW